MLKTTITRILAALALTLVVTGNVQAKAVSASEASAVREVVEAQLAAFAVDDAPGAFSYAAPAIREQFGNRADRFIAMVRSSYPVIYRPSGVVFLLPALADGTMVQGVRMRDSSGRLWLAIYNLERQPDDQWRITGCAVQAQAALLT